MRTPYGLEIIENCVDCPLRVAGMFCDLPLKLLNTFEALRYTTVFPKGAILFIEGQAPRGVFMICTGQVKLSTGSRDGKTLITHVAEAGEVLGLSAVISDKPYEVMAETLSPCQINFIKREDFLPFLSENSEVCLRVARQVSNDYQAAIGQSHALGLSNSAAKLAELILEWCARKGKPGERGVEIKLTLTHEEIAQMIGASRETITRLFSDFKGQKIIQVKGATLVVCDRSALQAIANS